MSLLDFGKKEEQTQGFIYTEEQLMARLKFFIGICLSLTLTGIVFVVLYSLIFVTQPLNAISPIDQKFFELIVPIATFLTGTLSGIMLAGNDKEAQKMALQAATRPTTVSPMPPTPGTTPSFGMGTSTPMNFGQMTTSPVQTQISPTAFSVPAGINNTVTQPVAAFAPQVILSSTGKPMPVQPPQPEI
jgi:hypothetical protein